MSSLYDFSLDPWIKSRKLAFSLETGNLYFNLRAGQIKHKVANGLPPLLPVLYSQGAMQKLKNKVAANGSGATFQIAIAQY